MNIKNKMLSMAMLLSLPIAGISHAEASDMKKVEIKGYTISGAEYLPILGYEEFAFPNHVQWGFYGELNTYGHNVEIPGNTLACAESSYAALSEFLVSLPQEFETLKDLGATRRVYMWVTDYSAATLDRATRPSSFWHVNSGGPMDFSKGYWKWEAVVKQDGTCSIPTKEQAIQFAQRIIGAYKQSENYCDFADGTKSSDSEIDSVICLANQWTDISAVGTTWQADREYVGGDEVVYEGVRYRAKWWNFNQNPKQYSTQGEPWEKLQ
ncbi:carbohydrate-binding protein [Pseudoalteromonas ardens]|uniref:Chitin-binding type-3 domain-containing protein n=1 Tax=Pseudoalteromonas rubra TaxID=43658 RepID=A0A0L0EYK6_9GAMM|nr:carbohydrate-binding protein [Pseudoalteromonas sp. R96]KNC68918.1 hypothetical protein AC626_01990 [Pseudoalteromonas rubra]MDK1310236.1 hypothetical protein [Pseudoalteromonas sp. R96]